MLELLTWSGVVVLWWQIFSQRRAWMKDLQWMAEQHAAIDRIWARLNAREQELIAWQKDLEERGLY